MTHFILNNNLSLLGLKSSFYYSGQTREEAGHSTDSDAAAQMHHYFTKYYKMSFMFACYQWFRQTGANYIQPHPETAE